LAHNEYLILAEMLIHQIFDKTSVRKILPGNDMIVPQSLLHKKHSLPAQVTSLSIPIRNYC
jgi:hypothetical protein